MDLYIFHRDNEAQIFLHTDRNITLGVGIFFPIKMATGVEVLYSE